jgi:RNA polymerase sigma-70 factor (ECF subfamily)
MEERTNEQWLEELCDGHPDQAQAIEDLRQYLKRGVMAYLRTRSDLRYLAQTELEQMSEDFTQEALLKIKDNLDTFRGNSKLTTWASKIASNLTISELRRAKWRDLSLDKITAAGTSLQEIMSTETPKGDDPDTAAERRQVWQTVMDVINDDLTDRQRQVLAAVQFNDIPMPEVARLLDTNVNNIYKIMHDARLKLKHRLQVLDLSPEYILKLFSEEG